MEECDMNNVFALRLKAQQAVGCLVMENLLAPEINQENEAENYPSRSSRIETSFRSGPLVDSRPLLSNAVNSPTFRAFSSPSSDRYIPSRGGTNWQTRFSLLPVSKTLAGKLNKTREAGGGIGDTNAVAGTYTSLLKNELFGTSIEDVNECCDSQKSIGRKSLFHFTDNVEQETNIESIAPFSLSPLGSSSHKLLRSSRKTTRKISKIPFKILDAPELQDDFYLNLVDWSSQNVLSVGLGTSVYLWSASTSQVTHLCDVSADVNSVTSVSWNERGNLIAVGTNNGYIEVWDVAASKQISKLSGHTARVGALAWSGDVLSSGSRDRSILQRDVRTPGVTPERRLPGHKQEVCGLKWSPDNQHLASGGNDNRLCVWNMHSTTPVQVFTEHVAAVKAIAWSPQHQGLLASGGGTADRCIRFWNTLIGHQVQCIDTTSQVCNLAWSKNSPELVSTHGYSQNSIRVWKYPSLNEVTSLYGHASRVLYLAMSPDGESIVTGAGDETLRFWNVFPKLRAKTVSKSVLNLFGNIR